MGKVIQGPWKGSVDANKHQKEEAIGFDNLRSYEQCCTQQEMAFSGGKYLEIFVVSGDYKRCYVQPCDRAAAERQIQAREAYDDGIFMD